jgi:biopolymer transport protein ExbD
MASIEGGGGDGGHKKGPGVKKAKKLSTRVDMTPMVDLGFLLITFFVFTSTMSEPKSLNLNMPKDDVKDDQKTEVKESSVLTILLGKGDKVYYYEGKLLPDASNFKSSTFKDIRKVIIDKKAEVKSRFNPATVDQKACDKEKEEARKKGDPNWERACEDIDFTVIIKPDEDATYKNAVDILDEMTINQVKRYAMVKPFEDEIKVVRATEAANNVK